ncbi:MAG: ABC transporter substrate-binding protein [Christensenellaceae bacterium]|nr:ABC transporter substrate-binding protein [Christensenellaceae bacterium]
MKKTRKLLCLLMAALLSVLSLMGCSASDNVKLTVSEVTHSVFYAPQYAAMALGFFEEQGLDIELVNGQGADKVMTSVLTEQVQIGLAGPEAAIYVYNEGREDYCKVFAQLTKRDGSFLMARQPDADFSYDKLEGKHVLGGRKGGMPYMALEYVIKNSGADIEKINLDTSIQFAMMTGAFTGGTGDYVTVFEPTATMLQNEGKGYIVSSIGQDSGEIPFTAYFAAKSYMEENPRIIEKFTAAIYAGQQWVQKAPAADIAAAIAPYFPDSSVEVLTDVVQRYKDIDAWSTTPIMSEEVFDRLQDVMQEAGELDKRADYGALIDNSFAEAVTAA